MVKKDYKIVANILALAGIKINGNSPSDIKVHNSKFYSRVLAGGSLALGESYMDGWWDCKSIDQFFTKLIRARIDKKVENKGELLTAVVKAKILNLQPKSKAYNIGKKHYDIGNDLYKNMLDKRMMYSCGYWKNAKTLNISQEDKVDLICKKLQLKQGMTVLDIGCGWGGFAKYAAEKYKVKVVGITVSKEQVKFVKDLCKGLPVEIRLQDYRDLNEKFDCIVSIGMFEHVGPKNYKEYMGIVSKCLKDEGLFLLHTIGGTQMDRCMEPWLDKYIFPNAILPSTKQITRAADRFFVMEDWHNFGVDYDKTLMEWYKNFTKNWPKIKKDYNQRFYRMWVYYLLSCAGMFRARKTQLWQIVFSKNRTERGYKSIR